MRAKDALDIRADVLCHRIYFKRERLRNGGRPRGTKARAIFGVKIPLATHRLTILHEIPGSFTHPAVKEFHAQAIPTRFIAGCCPRLKIIYRTQKVRIRALLEATL